MVIGCSLETDPETSFGKALHFFRFDKSCSLLSRV